MIRRILCWLLGHLEGEIQEEMGFSYGKGVNDVIFHFRTVPGCPFCGAKQ